MDEMNITPFSSSHPQRLFEAVAWSESTIGLLHHHNILNEATSPRFPQLSIQRTPHDVVTPHPTPHPPSVNNNDTCNVTTSPTKQHLQGFHNSQSNALHMTLLHPPHPPPPSCKQQRYLQHNNILNEATSSRFPQLTIQRTPHDVITPHPMFCFDLIPTEVHA